LDPKLQPEGGEHRAKKIPTERRSPTVSRQARLVALGQHNRKEKTATRGVLRLVTISVPAGEKVSQFYKPWLKVSYL